MILENIRDKKLLELYIALTRSNFKGAMNNSYVVRLLYALLCVDIKAKERGLSMAGNRMLDYAKEIIRIYDVKEYNETDDYSVEVLTDSMLNLMENEKLTYSDIHKMNARELKDNVCKYKASE